VSDASGQIRLPRHNFPLPDLHNNRADRMIDRLLRRCAVRRRTAHNTSGRARVHIVQDASCHFSPSVSTGPPQFPALRTTTLLHVTRYVARGRIRSLACWTVAPESRFNIRPGFQQTHYIAFNRKSRSVADGNIVYISIQRSIILDENEISAPVATACRSVRSDRPRQRFPVTISSTPCGKCAPGPAT
jgi:hypothetical protein